MAWKVSLPKMANNATTKLIQRSIEKNMTKKENDITMTFVRDNIFGKTDFGDLQSLPDGHGKEEFTNSRILLNQSKTTYIWIHI